jgi:ketosteroid isomerase-like protein
MRLKSIAPGQQHSQPLLLLATAFLLGSLGAGCQDGGSQRLTDAQEDALTDTIRAELDGILRAYNEHRTDAALQHFSEDVQGFVLGTHYSGTEFEKWFRGTVAAQQSVSAEMINPQINVLGPGSAVASFRYREQIVDTTGMEYQIEGVQTYAFNRRAGDWKVVQVQAQHVSPNGGS